MANKIQVVLSEAKKEEIARAAEECALTSSSFVRQAIKEKIDRMKPKE